MAEPQQLSPGPESPVGAPTTTTQTMPQQSNSSLSMATPVLETAEVSTRTQDCGKPGAHG